MFRARLSCSKCSVEHVGELDVKSCFDTSSRDRLAGDRWLKKQKSPNVCFLVFFYSLLLVLLYEKIWLLWPELEQRRYRLWRREYSIVHQNFSSLPSYFCDRCSKVIDYYLNWFHLLMDKHELIDHRSWNATASAAPSCIIIHLLAPWIDSYHARS